MWCLSLIQHWATGGQYLALSKTWDSCLLCGLYTRFVSDSRVRTASHVEFRGEHAVKRVVFKTSSDELLLRQYAVLVGVHLGKDLSRSCACRLVVNTQKVRLRYQIDGLQQTGARTVRTSAECFQTSADVGPMPTVYSAVRIAVRTRPLHCATLTLPNLTFDLSSWKMAHRLLLSWATFTNFSFTAPFFELGARAGYGQTDRQTDGRTDGQDP